MKRVEIESFIKSFLLFFISLSSIIAFLFYQSYQSNIHDFEDSIYSQMKIASLGNNIGLFTKQIVPKKENLILNSFYLEKKKFFVYFKSKDSNNTLIKVSYPALDLAKGERVIFKASLEYFLEILVLIFIISVLFSLYALYPYKQYLKLTDEFVKDILHDFNTPISTIRLNLSILKKSIDNKNIKRIEGGVETILNLQNNLKEYLEDEIPKSEKFGAKEIILQRVLYMQGVYPNIKFDSELNDKVIYCYKDGFIRILDNILSNACKYNTKDGTVVVTLGKDNILRIEDSGYGIKKPKKIFNRFYKETSRGLGIGLHIVQKLSKKMKIPLHVSSTLGVGTTFELDLSKLILN